MVDHINVFPKLQTPSRKNGTYDPDVAKILNTKKGDSVDNEDLLSRKHEPTEEERKSTKSDPITESRWPSRLIIGLSIIVVILVIIIVWYVLKNNTECEPHSDIPKGIIQPNRLPPSAAYPNQHYYNKFQMPHQYTQNQAYQMDPNNTPQTENLPIQTKTMGIQPSKDELLNTLNKMTLETIKEEPPPDKKLKPRVAVSEKPISTDQIQISTVTENSGVDDEDQQDSELEGKFYKNLQKDADDDIQND